jgi:catechol 2,3-dioxygenase-like lactoylglutathione lyase family enzyme
VPVLHVADSTIAERFYCGQLGFARDFAYRPLEEQPDPCYQGLHRGDARIHLSSFAGDGVAGGVVYLPVSDVDALYRELLSKRVSIDLSPTDQTWGNREMYVRDPDGNSLRFIGAPRS